MSEKYQAPSRPTYNGVKKYSDDDSKSTVLIGTWNSNSYLEFEKVVADGQSLKIKCFMNGIKMVEFMSVMESFYKERLEHFAKNKTHKDIQERIIQVVKHDYETKNYNVISHIKLSLNENKDIVLTGVKDDLSIPIVFSTKTPLASDISYFSNDDKLLLMNLDIKDLGFWNFHHEFKTHIKVVHPMYGLLVPFFEFYIGKKFFDKNNPASSGANYYNNSAKSSMIDGSANMTSIESSYDDDEF